MSTKPASGARLYSWLGVSAPFDPNRNLVTSPVCSPLVLAIIRLALGSYALFVVLFHLIWDAVRDHDADSFFSYFTHLSYIGLVAYYFAAGVQTLCYALKGGKEYPLQKWPRPLQLLHTLLYSTITTYPLVVTVIFWALLSGPSTFDTRFDTWINISQHAMNSAYALFEITLTNAGPSPWLHLPLCVFMLACYLGVAYITHATQGFYTYSFLDPQKEGAKLAGYIIGVGVAEVLAFLLARGLAVLRVRLTRRGAWRRANSLDQGQAIDEWEDVERPKSPTVAVV
ncbi:uncharacterized protein TRAVEDRAFT_64129 [Trametes versicolor FP-101664 SS1]|uniref:uncharacterized protein n=1 Tax=Trametes versicolor (strain FP-101664) TaxID=717944 RepID=UPI0004623A77|nr:uncharacterized protein TRAVEDRAFT_64129 [Trametes versicolor FP-101664 SS1]EIW60734.1 hypothetical protein TRAVEDRAFT_64129 [Trametes versicolor FP-101664 SS1]